MPRPGFYNDNEYRAYPFIFKPNLDVLPNSAVVDCGIIMGLDSEFNGDLHSVWLKTVRRIDGVFEFEFDTNAPGAADRPLVFRRAVSADEWLSEDAESDPYRKDDNSCAIEPAWSGFLVTGPLTDLQAALPENGMLSLGTNYVLEPARVQSLVRTYLRAISLGNLSRPMASDDCDPPDDGTRYVVINKRCVTGDIRFKEGYNAQIRQRQAANEIAISAGRNSGTIYDGDICKTKGEVKFYDDEKTPPLGGMVPTVFKERIFASNVSLAEALLPPEAENKVGDTYCYVQYLPLGDVLVTFFVWNNAEWEKLTGTVSNPQTIEQDPSTGMPPEIQRRSKFLSGGWACNDLVSAINGVPGPDVSIVGGTGIEVTTDQETNTIYVDLSSKAIGGNC